MKYNLHFSGLHWNPSEHEADDGSVCALVNLISEDGVLKPCRMPKSAIESWNIEGLDNSKVKKIIPAGDSLCILTDEETLVALKVPNSNYYAVVRRDDLLYDLTVSQDTTIPCSVSTEITTTFSHYLKAINEPLPTRRTLIDRIFPYFYDSQDAYATGATMIAAQMEAVIDREASRLGNGVFKHICFGIVALRLIDGSTTLYSNLFALIPTLIPSTIYVDHESGQLLCQTALHRHRITVTMRHPDAYAINLVESAEVYLSRPVSFLDMRKALQYTTDDQGLATSLTYGFLGPQATAEVFEHLEFYPSTTIERHQLGIAVALQNVSTQNDALRLDDLHRWTAVARHAFVSDGRLYLADCHKVFHHPFEIGMSYIYHTSDAITRKTTVGDDREQLLQSEMLVGTRPDIYDQPNGVRAEMLVKLTYKSGQEMCFCTEVSYPLTGPLMYPYHEVSYIEVHLRIMAPDGEHYHPVTAHLRDMVKRGYRAAAFAPSGGPHRASQPAFHSLLFQQVRNLYLDSESGEYLGSSWLWQAETAADFAQAKTEAKVFWKIPLRHQDTLSSPISHPFALQHDAPDECPSQFPSAYDDIMSISVSRQLSAYTSPQGVMLHQSGQTICVSEALHGHPFDLTQLPCLSEIISTLPYIDGSLLQYGPFRKVFLPNAHLYFDPRHQRLFLYPATSTTNGYALVYSLHSKQWGAISAGEPSTPQSPTPFLLCSRALHLGKRHLPKRVKSIAVRGYFESTFHHSHISIALYGSNDLFHWQLITTSRNCFVSHLHGTPYHWFRVLVLGTLNSHESIEGLEFQIE